MIVYREVGFRALHSHHGMMVEVTHPHNFKVVVGIRGEPNEEGFVCDFRAVKRIMKRLVVDTLEGTDLDKLFDYATSENLAVWVWNRLEPFYPLASVEILEKPHSKVIYYGPGEGPSRRLH